MWLRKGVDERREAGRKEENNAEVREEVRNGDDEENRREGNRIEEK